MNKNILFLVTGMTPQIITETLWALACDPSNDSPWLPDEIHVMSTQDGLIQIKDRLLAKGNFARLLADYQLPAIRFDDSCLHCIQSSTGEPLHDLKTPEDNQQAADAICAMIRQFTEDEHTSLHVSIAGGRKTMGFYAGYALSLYGRAQDKMSHVLVSNEFESIQDFYYPTPKSHYITDRNGRAWDAKNAQVWLANIAFVRMKEAIKEKHQLKSQDSYSQVVRKINNSFNAAHLTVDLSDNTFCFNRSIKVKLPPREFAMLYWFADLCRQSKSGIRAPKYRATDKNVPAQDSQHMQQLTEEFAHYYGELKNLDNSDFILDKGLFESVKSNLGSLLIQYLGLETAAQFSISQDKRGMPFSLNLPASAIEIRDSFH